MLSNDDTSKLFFFSEYVLLSTEDSTKKNKSINYLKLVNLQTITTAKTTCYTKLDILICVSYQILLEENDAVNAG